MASAAADRGWRRLTAIGKRGNPAGTMPWTSEAIAQARRWSLPSLGAAAAGALIGASTEAVLRVDGIATQLASLGYAVLGMWPTLAMALLIARLLRLGWTPPVVNQGSGARWLAVAIVGVLALIALGWTAWFTVVWATFHTAFKPNTLALLLPIAVVGCGALVLAAAWPCTRALTHALVLVDARWQKRHGVALLTGRRVAVAMASAVASALAALGYVIRLRLGAIDLAFALAPLLAVLVAVIFQHWLVATRRYAVAVAACAVASTAVVVGFAVRSTDPAQLLDAWAQPTIASEVIERVHSLEALRGSVSPAAAALLAHPGVDHPDVVLITIDTFRADRAPPLGASATMPTLAALAARGTAFTRAFAAGNVTRRSLPSLVTSLAATRVRGQMYGWALRLDPRHVLLAERFAASGYQTAGFLCCEGFWAPARKLGLNRGLQVLQLTEVGETLAEQARSWLAGRRAAGERRPLFLWMHFMEPHKWNGSSVLLPAPEQVRAQYDATLTRVDAMLATVFEGLASSPARPTIIAITADHGEGLGDHGAAYHSTNLYNSQLQIPLIIAGPGVVAQTAAEVVGLVDVAPTLIDLAGFQVPPAPQFEGRSLAGLLRGQRASDDDGGYAFAAMIPDRVVQERRSAVMRGRWKMISSAAGLELYDTLNDPGELRNLANTAPQAAEMKKLLDARKDLDAQSPFGKLSR